MKKHLTSQSAFFNRRVLISFAFCSIGVLLALLAFALYPGGTALAKGSQQNQSVGQGRPLTPEEAQKVAEGIKLLVNQSTEGLVQVQRADGSVSMDLQGRFQNVTVAKKEADGSVSQSCVDNVDSAAAFFGINSQLIDPAKAAPGSQNQPGPKPEDR
jgi:hypothetical protein